MCIFMKTKKDASFGVIPIRRKNNEWEVFIIHQFSRIGNNSYWIFPKGHPEGVETPEETALRELKEETGMSVRELVKDKVFTLSYDFYFDGVKIDKKVQYFVGEVESDEYQLQEQEVKEAGWYALSDVTDRLDYKGTKQMFVEAKSFIETYRAD